MKLGFVNGLIAAAIIGALLTWWLNGSPDITATNLRHRRRGRRQRQHAGSQLPGTGRPMSILASWLALALAINWPAAAQLFGGTTAQDCAAVVAGDVRDHSTVSVVCGIPEERVAEFMRLAVSGRPGDYAELLRRLDAMIPADARLRVEALARFFAILGEAEDVPPERLMDKAGRDREPLSGAAGPAQRYVGQ